MWHWQWKRTTHHSYVCAGNGQRPSANTTVYKGGPTPTATFPPFTLVLLPWWKKKSEWGPDCRSSRLELFPCVSQLASMCSSCMILFFKWTVPLGAGMSPQSLGLFYWQTKNLGMTLAGVTQLVGASSCTPKGGGFDPWLGHVQEKTDWCFTLIFLSLSPPLSLTSYLWNQLKKK